MSQKYDFEHKNNLFLPYEDFIYLFKDSDIENQYQLKCIQEESHSYVKNN